MENNFFEQLLEMFNYSGAKYYQALESGADHIEIQHNWDVKKETMDTLKNKYPDYNIDVTNTTKFKWLRKLDKNYLKENLKESNLFRSLCHWMGNDTTTVSMAYEISEFLSNSEYDLYILWRQASDKRKKYLEILDEIYVTSCAFIFESERDIKSISLMWTD